MSYQIIFSDYFSSDWYQFITSLVKTQKINTEEYKSFGTFSQETNWEKIFALGDTINRDLQIKEQEIIDEYESWKETMEIMSDPGLMKAIRQGEKEISEGKGIPWDDVKKS